MTREELIEVMAETASRLTAGNGWDAFSDAYRDECRAEMRAALAAIEAAGVRLVPMEATEEMLSRGNYICHDAYPDEFQADATEVYTAMLAASPYNTKETK